MCMCACVFWCKDKTGIDSFFFLLEETVKFCWSFQQSSTMHCETITQYKRAKIIVVLHDEGLFFCLLLLLLDQRL